LLYQSIKQSVMNLLEAKKLAIDLMSEHGILDQGWRFQYDNAKRRFGRCSYSTKTISLSKHLVLLNELEIVKNTILHEIAHALTPGAGHSRIWQRKAIEIGCSGDRCYSSFEVQVPESRYISECKGCGYTHKRHKMTDRLKYGKQSCGRCSNGRYDEKYKLEWKVNPKF
jgi:predicted SprT family Zn-dependent metalloprotease